MFYFDDFAQAVKKLNELNSLIVDLVSNSYSLNY